MLDDTYLLLGLDALSRAHQTDYFADGHRGAAILSAYFLCQEEAMETGVVRVIRALIDEHWGATDLCAPLPDEPAEPGLEREIVECLRENLQGLRQAGHNVIFPSLALRAFRRLPRAVTPTRVAGICELIRSFRVVHDVRLRADDRIPELGLGPAAARFILYELLKSVCAFEGRGQGWSGHLLTYGRAILDLRDMGYDGLAREAEPAFRLYVKRIRMGPLATDAVRAEYPPSDDRPQQRQYWERRKARPLRLGHVFKYPYAYCGLMRLAEDARLEQACQHIAYHIL